MPRLGTESSASRRHNPTQTLSHFFLASASSSSSPSAAPAPAHSHPEFIFDLDTSLLPRDPAPTLTPTPTSAAGAGAETGLSLSHLRLFDGLDEASTRAYAPTHAAHGRTRWRTRRAAGPYGQRPLHKWLPSEHRLYGYGGDVDADADTEGVGEGVGAGVRLDTFLDVEGGDGEDERGELEGKGLKAPVEVQLGTGGGEEAAKREEDNADVDVDVDSRAGLGHGEGRSLATPQEQARPLSPAVTKRREKNKKKKAKMRAKAQEEVGTDAGRTASVELNKSEAEAGAGGSDAAEPPRADTDTPQDLLASMSRIARLVGSLNPHAHAGVAQGSGPESDALLQRMRHALGEAQGQHVDEQDQEDETDNDAQPATPAEWRAEVLQSVRRMESMLTRMEQWQARVAPGEIEALRLETVWLERRVRSVVLLKEGVGGDVEGWSAEGEEGEAGETAEVPVSDAKSPLLDEEEDSDSLFDGVPESGSSPEESDAGLETEDLALLDDGKDVPLSPSIPPAATPPVSEPALDDMDTPGPQPPAGAEEPQLSDAFLTMGPHGFILPAAPTPTPTAGAPAPTTLASKNHNVPPAPPADPVRDLTEYPWSMLEVLFLLEVIAHFPPAENGWNFIAEAYNNILITRPLQEWFERQAAASRDEEDKMRGLLRKLHKEAFFLRGGGGGSGRRAGPGAGKAGERGKAAPFGSVEARAEASAHAHAPVPSTAKTSPGNSSAHAVVTVLPFPVHHPVAGAAPTHGPAPLQCIFPFPRRRPPLGLPTEYARAFARVMRSAAAGVRPPSAESRAAMVELYGATEAKFPVRTPWDCWQRWCTPWVVPEAVVGASRSEGGGDGDGSEGDAEGGEGEGEGWGEGEGGRAPPPMVLDYVVGNVCLPCGTWVAQGARWPFRPVPGTYPDVPGVMHRVSAEYDPRPGMATFARMAHLMAERAWAAEGLGRGEDGMVGDEVLASRRMRLPATLAGLWPGKAVLKPRARAGAAAPAAASPPGSTPIPPPASPAPIPKLVPPTTKRAGSASASSLPQPGAPPAIPPPPTPTTEPRLNLIMPLPTPRRPPPRDAPNVPEGTLGNPVRPGVRAWFQLAAVRADVLERVTSLKSAALAFERAMAMSPSPVGRKDAPGAKSHLNANAMDSTLGQWAKEYEHDKWIPFHLRKVAVPPPPRLGLGDGALGRAIAA